jgi:hypothetical protein
VSQTSVKDMCDIAGYMVPVVQNGALKWEKKLESGTITRGLMPEVQYRKFWKSMDGKCFPTRCTVLT